MWNANPHCHKASFSLTKDWRHSGVRGCVCVCVCVSQKQPTLEVLHYCRLSPSHSMVCVNKAHWGVGRWSGREEGDGQLEERMAVLKRANVCTRTHSLRPGERRAAGIMSRGVWVVGVKLSTVR